MMKAYDGRRMHRGWFQLRLGRLWLTYNHRGWRAGGKHLSRTMWLRGPFAVARAAVSTEDRMRELVVGVFRQRGRIHRHSWVDHIGIIDHLYGPHKNLAWVHTLCGRKGAMMNPTSYNGDRFGLCGSCKSLAASEEDT